MSGSGSESDSSDRNDYATEELFWASVTGGWIERHLYQGFTTAEWRVIEQRGTQGERRHALYLAARRVFYSENSFVSSGSSTTADPGSGASSVPDWFSIEGEGEDECGFESTDNVLTYPPNLNLASLQEISPGVYSMCSPDEHLKKLDELLQRRQDHITEFENKFGTLPKVHGQSVLPPVEASPQTNLHIQPSPRAICQPRSQLSAIS